MASKTTYQLDLILGGRTSASFSKSINSANRSLSSMSNIAKLAVAGIATSFMTANITGKIEDITETFAGFEQELANTSAIASATAAEQEKLSNAAKQAGRDTIYTAENSAAALGYMALAGWDVNTSTKALMPTLRLASATQADLKTTSDLVTDSMSALKIGVGDINTYLDLLIKGNNDANTTAEQLMEALIKSGGAARTLGASLNDDITALEVFANNGLKGTDAGTAFNSILVRLAGNSEAIKELNRLDVDIWDNGKFIGLKNTIVELEKAFSNLTDEQKAQSLKKIAGTHYYTQMSYLLDSVSESVKGQSGSWDELEKKLGQSSGALDRMYDKTTDTLNFAQERWSSAQDASKIDLAETFSDNYKDTLNWMADKLPEVTDAVIDFANAHEKDIAEAFEDAQDLMESTWDAVETGGTWLIKNKGAVISGIKGIGAALGTSFAIGKTSSLISFLTNFSNPAFLAGAGITAGVGAFVAIKSAIEEADKAAAQANLDAHFGSISLSLDELDSVARKIVGEDSLNGVTKLLDALSETEKSLDSVSEAWSNIQKNTWQLNTGFKFDTEESEKYQAAIENYIDSVEQFAVNKGYEVHIAASLLFGDDSSQVASADSYFSSVEKELDGYSKELSKVLSDAMLDGVVDADEDAIAQELIQKINNVQQKISDAESTAKLEAIKLKYNGSELDTDSFKQLEKDISAYTEEISDGALKAYQTTVQSLAIQKEDKAISEEQYQKDLIEAQNSYYKLQGDAVSKGLTYMVNSIDSAYPELEGNLNKVQTLLDEYSSNILSKDSLNAVKSGQSINWDTILNNFSNEVDAVIGKDQKNAISALLESMEPTTEQLEDLKQKYIAAGQEIPSYVQEGLNQVLNLKALTGDSDAIWQLLGGQLENSSNYAQLQAALEKSGQELPESIAAGMDSNKAVVDTEINNQYDYTKNQLNDTFSKGFDIDTELRLNFNKKYAGLTAGDMTKTKSIDKVPRNAKGGIYDKPLLTTFAEEGPEAAIPLDGSARAKGLLFEAAQRMGMTSSNRAQKAAESLSTSTGSGMVINFSPQIIIQGNASQADVQKACSLSISELKSMLKSIENDNKRVAFS